ncbi:RDD family protein [Streptomyces sp. HNM0575]|uniref:RDD family protein n=1 Tax=Streptomyces sp. HNM0575 TaxID=2716338 RepID=UPI00145EF600|nr:RDD family protein [Streptomyces sp. HNM0575]NLU71191.1 RDD family protein [Streptomyces sp. HNM0575]
MSSPLSGSSGGNPAPGFYPDPSIPGYIRYWNGTSWVPGTSRPEPQEGDAMPTPPSAAVSSSAVAPPTREEPAPAEETGPVFLDEDTGGLSQLEVRPRGEVAQAGAGAIDWEDPSRLYGQRPEPASAWQADASHQAGFTGQSEERVSWGRGESGAEPAADPAAGAGFAAADPRGGWGRTGDEVGTGGDAPADPAAPAAPAADPQGPAGAAGPAGTPQRDGTFQMRAMSPEALGQAAQEARDASGGVAAQGGSCQPEHTVGLRRSEVAQSGPSASQPPSQSPSQSAPASPAQSAAAPSTPSAPSAPSVPHQGAPAQQPPAQQQAPQQAAPPQAPPAVPQQGGVPSPGPAQPSWAQQVHDLAGGQGGQGGPGGVPGAGPDPQGAHGQEGVVPWRPPVADPFQSAQMEARPAALGKRFAARLVDGVLTGAVAAAVAFPFVGEAVDHVQGKIDAVRNAGETRTVWLIDGTTGGYLALVLGALLLFGLLYEVLPTSRWGRTLGKKLFGLRVLTMEQQDKPGFGSALTRWLTYGVLSALVVGVVNVLWCVFDRPWRQCWHDKLAGTFVSKDSGEIRL